MGRLSSGLLLCTTPFNRGPIPACRQYEVAAAKQELFGAGPCVYDAMQEAGVLSAANDLAQSLGLRPSAALTLVQIQADCAKQEQAYWTKHWHGKPPPPQRPLDELREQLQAHNAAIFAGWSEAVEPDGEWSVGGCECVWSTLERELAQGFAALRSPCAGPEFRSMLVAALLAAWDESCNTVAENSVEWPLPFGAPPGPRRGPLISPTPRPAQFLEI